MEQCLKNHNRKELRELPYEEEGMKQLFSNKNLVERSMRRIKQGYRNYFQAFINVQIKGLLLKMYKLIYNPLQNI